MRKKNIISIALSVLLSVVFVAVAANAATTISTNISTAGTLTVTGVSLFNGSLQASTTALFTSGLTSYRPIRVGATGSYQSLDTNASEAGYFVFATSPMATATELRGIEARVKTTGGTHPADGFLQAGRFAATVDTGTVSLEEAWGINSTLAVNAGHLNAAYGTVGDLNIGTGVVVDGAINSGVFGVFAQSYVHTGVTFTNSAKDIALAGVILEATGRRKADAAVAAILQGDSNQSSLGAYAAFKVYDSNTDSGANFDYGLDLYDVSGSYSVVFDVADIRLQNGETISNATDGIIAINATTTIAGNLRIVNPYTLSVTGTDPSTQVKLMYTASDAIASGKQLQGLQVVATGNTSSVGGVTAGEFKARADVSYSTAADQTLNQLRGIISTADARNKNVTSIEGIEANIASYTGATIGTAYGLQVTQQLQPSTATNIYGISIKADNVVNTADIQLSGGANATNRPEIRSGSGVPDNAGCTATTNLGSLYINTAGTAAAHTLLYVCTESGNWVGVQATTGF